MSTRIRSKASTPLLIRATTIIRMVIGCLIANLVGFMSKPLVRLAHVPCRNPGARQQTDRNDPIY